MKKIAFLFSGRGTLLTSVKNAIADTCIPAELRLVITNNRDFESAHNPVFSGVSVIKVNHQDYENRDSFEKKIADYLNESDVDLIILGGFRRIFSSNFVRQFGHKTMNTHPSILPAFPGDKAQLRAINQGVKISGATLHFINDEVDAGPIIDQEPVRIANGMTENDLKEAILLAEKNMLYRAVRAFIEGRITLDGDKVIYEGNSYV
ncbi:TPA: phosphoribosylglycinamide formyltransferase [Salmonella enterica subsp. enterica serovar Typhimurium]